MRNQVFKKLFSVLLALIMVAGLLPASVLAEGEGNAETTPAPTGTVQPIESAEPTEPAETETPDEPAATPEATEVPEPTPENPATTEPAATDEPAAEPTPAEEITIAPVNEVAAQENVVARDTSKDGYYSIVHLDCGREYFTKDWIIALINEMADAGYNQLQLAFGNGGFRFYLDDMAIGNYKSDRVKAALEAGNNHYNTYGDGEDGPDNKEWISYAPKTNALTETEMNAIIDHAKSKGIEIVPMLNTPGHMHAVLAAMSDLGIGGTLQVSEGCLNLDNEDAVSFTKELVKKYIEYFSRKENCNFFNLAMDEYSSFDNTFFSYANELIGYVSGAVMTPRVFNDALSRGQSNGFNSGTQVCCWDSVQNTNGYSVINTSHDFYYVSTNEDWNLSPIKGNYGEGYTFVGEYVENTWITHAKKFNNNTFLYKGTSSNISPVGSMFCIWCNTPGRNDETAIARQIRMILRVIGACMQNRNDYSASDVLVEGGFKADGSINVTINNTTVGNTNKNTKLDDTNDTVRVTGPALAKLTCEAVKSEITGINAAEGKMLAYNVTPATEDGATYTDKAEVRIKIPTGWDSSKVKAFVVTEGTAESITGTATEDGWYVFDVQHFSVMGIYEEAVTYTDGGEIEIVAGGTGVIVVKGNVDESKIYNPDDTQIAEKVGSAEHSQEADGETKFTLGDKITTGEGVISDGNGNYLVVSDSGSLSNTTEIANATVFTVTSSTSWGNTNYTIKVKDKEQYLTIINNNYSSYTLGIATSSSSWSYSTRNVGYYQQKGSGWSSTNYYLKFYNNWTASDSRNGTNGYLYERKGSATLVDVTKVTIKGKAVGETTIVIGDKIYTIKVVAEKLYIDFWVTNHRIEPDGLDYKTTSTLDGTTSVDNARNYATFAAEDFYGYGEEGKLLSDVIPKTGYAPVEGVAALYWKVRFLPHDQRQDRSGWTNKSGYGTDTVTGAHGGVDIESIRFYEGKWAYKAVGATNWETLSNVTADESGDQVVAYYLLKTEVTDEVTTYITDWPDPNDTKNIFGVALDYCVKYESNGTRNPNVFGRNYKSQWFNCQGDGAAVTNGYTLDSSKVDIDSSWEGPEGSQYYRVINNIRGEETADYEIYMITITPSTEYFGSETTYYECPETITYSTEEGAEKVIWAESQDTVDMSGLTQHSELVIGGTPDVKRVLIRRGTGMLVTYYVRAKVTEDALTVHYINRKNNNQEFYYYNIAVNNGVVFPEVGTCFNNGVLSNYSVQNKEGNTETIKSDLKELPKIAAQYRYSKFTCVEVMRSEDGKDFYLYYTFDNEVTFVVDFGLPIKVTPIDVNTSLDRKAKRVEVTQKTVDYGTVAIEENGVDFTYTLNKMIDGYDTIVATYYGTGIYGTEDKVSYNIHIIPATNVYYEDSFAKFTDGSYNGSAIEWTTEEKGTVQNAETTQALEALGTKENVYGYDPAYDNCTMFSMGSAHKVTVTQEMVNNWKDATSAWPTAQFTFKGTGFDIISLTDNTSGAIFVDVYNTKTGDKEKSVFVDNYYGYTYNSATKTWEATPEKTNVLYQIPVIALRNLSYAEHNVVIKVAYSEYFDHTAEPKGSYNFWLDAVRVYNPMGESENTGDTYKDDNESFPQYIKLRDELAKTENTTVKIKSMVFIDGGNTAEIATYANIGPNNEVYLANGQAITFKLSGDNLSKIATVQIGAKSPNSDKTNKANMAIGSTNDIELNTATEMYYDITNAAKTGNAITVTNNGNAILSLTNLKITYTAEGSVSLGELSDTEKGEAVQVVRALFAPAPVEPEPEPEPEKTFEPDRFEASWSRNVMQGRKATLTVKTSEDVKAITVDGQTIRSYRTRTERVGFGRYAKRVTYREFTYSMVAQETADFSVTAINAKGTESEAITARLTVQKRPGSIRDVWNWFKGWF